MSGEIRLDSRLKAIMDFVKPGSVVADIGCDHGYLICALAKNGLIKHGFACEANLKPLERAKKTIAENCLFDSIDTVLTNGLNDLPHSMIDTFVIAGMGGELISDILLSHSWIFDNRFNFILQPMTKAEKLRQAIYENGFTISNERAVICDNKVYTIMNVIYTDRTHATDIVSLYTGMLLDSTDVPSRLYLEQTLRHIEKKAQGLLNSKNPENAEKYLDLSKKIRERLK